MSGKCSRPQKSSPSRTKVGTPKTPIASAAADEIELLPTLPDEIGRKTRGIGAGFGQHRADHIGIFDVELTLPEALEDGVMVTAQERIALSFGIEHAA